jgi:D-glycero-D-manno-heptose 1,7-bisphosphate phosphatase
MNKAIFLDRDGVLNRVIVRDGKPYPPSHLSEFEILPGTKEALIKLKLERFLLIVVTNQPDVARGKQKREKVEEMHNFLMRKLPLNDIFVCWHGLDGECECRKPMPGLLFQASKKWQIDLKKSLIIGDRWRDIDSGYAAGCKTIFIDYKYDEELNIQPDYIATSIQDATQWVIENHN